MKQEDKELLLKDLCARLPYGVKINESIQGDFTVIGLTTERVFTTCETEGCHNDFPIECIKPYLFPLSSMSNEQREELNKKFNVQLLGNTIYSIHYHSSGYWDNDLELDLQDWLWFINWCYKNHFDINNLIEKGLAINATGLNVYKITS